MTAFGIALSATSVKASDRLLDMQTSPHCTQTAPVGIDTRLYLWPETEIDAYHGQPAVYAEKPMFYCHNPLPPTRHVTYVWPSWEYARREDWFYPITFVDTVAGVLALKGRETAKNMTLDGAPFIEGLLSGRIYQAHPEGGCKPSIVIVELEGNSDEVNKKFGGLRMIDFGVSPPFISPDIYNGRRPELVIDNLEDIFSDPADYFSIRKISPAAYELSILNDQQVQVAYIYDREQKSLTRQAR